MIRVLKWALGVIVFTGCTQCSLLPQYIKSWDCSPNVNLDTHTLDSSYSPELGFKCKL